MRPGVAVAILGNDERSSFLSSKRSAGGLPWISSWYGGVIKCAGFGSGRILGGDWWGCANRQGRESMVLAALSACFCLLYLAVARALLLALYVCRNGDALWASGRFASPSSSTVEATTSCRTNWAVRGNWADTGDLNALESFSLHSVTWMVGEPMESILMGGDVICEHVTR